MTLLSRGHEYWFLYEGTPGGSLEPNSDFMIRPDGTETPLSESWEADLEGEEWVTFVDPVSGRSLFVAHHEDDLHGDLYRPMEGNMTVFGFGRSSSPLAGLMSEVPQRFSIGLSDETEYAPSAVFIRSVLSPPPVTVGQLEALD